MIKVRANKPWHAAQLTEGVLDLRINLPVGRFSVLMGNIKGVNVKNVEHPFPRPLNHGAGTTAGGLLRPLRDDGMSGNKDCQATAP